MILLYNSYLLKIANGTNERKDKLEDYEIIKINKC